MVKFITSNAVFTAANQGYGRSDGEMETDSFELAGPLPFPGVSNNSSVVNYTPFKMAVIGT